MILIARNFYNYYFNIKNVHYIIINGIIGKIVLFRKCDTCNKYINHTFIPIDTVYKGHTLS